MTPIHVTLPKITGGLLFKSTTVVFLKMSGEKLKNLQSAGCVPSRKDTHGIQIRCGVKAIMVIQLLRVSFIAQSWLYNYCAYLFSLLFLKSKEGILIRNK